MQLIIQAISCLCLVFFFFKQKTAYEMSLRDWSSDVCSSDLVGDRQGHRCPLGCPGPTIVLTSRTLRNQATESLHDRPAAVVDLRESVVATAGSEAGDFREVQVFPEGGRGYGAALDHHPDRGASFQTRQERLLHRPSQVFRDPDDE